MAVIRFTSNCGLHELCNIQDGPKRSIRAVCKSFFEEDDLCGAVLFTDHVPGWAPDYDFNEGESLKTLILDNKLGDVQVTEFHNPNSDNKVRTYMWTVDKKALRRYWLASKKATAVKARKRA